MISKLLITSTDAYVNQDAPARNYGSARQLYLSSQASHARYAFVLFGLPFPAGAIITSAILHLTPSAAATSTAFTIKRVTGRWVESKIAYGNMPAVTATHAATSPSAALVAGQTVDVDVTALLADVAAGAVWYGLRIESSGTALRQVWAEDAPNDLGPQLTVTWTLAPDAATDLSPAGGVVGSTTPIVSWTFRDVNGTTDQASSQVQVDDATDFATPVSDTGMIANDQWSQQVAAIADGLTRYWRVRVTDTDGNVSEWSDAAALTVHVLPTLTLSQPAATIDDTTPVVAWSLSSGTQKSYQVILKDVTGKAKTLWDTGRVASSSSSIEVPGGLIAKADAGAYTLEVRVWDSVANRVSTADVPAYADAQLTLTYTAAGPAGVDTLTATDDGAGVILHWTRSATPDLFALYVDVDGKLELPPGTGPNGEPWDSLNPSDYTVAGGGWSVEWWRAEPGVQHTYQVRARVTSTGALHTSPASGLSVTHATATLGLWLVDEDTGDRVQLLDTPEPSWAIGEDATDYFPLGRRDPVRITTSLRGYEGSMTGLLLDDSDGLGTTAIQWRDTLEGMRGAGVPLRMIVRTFNLPVRIHNVAVNLLTPTQGYSTSFDFAQVAEWPFDVTDMP